jgi:large subunit ribosomal protein L19
VKKHLVSGFCQLYMSEKKDEIKEEKESNDLDLKPGMTVRVYQKIKELNSKGEEKERVQYFEGMIIARKHNKEKGGTITVRKVSDGVGVEKIFPLNLPTITKIEVKKIAEVKRAKLYFLKRGYKKKLKEKVIRSKA